MGRGEVLVLHGSLEMLEYCFLPFRINLQNENVKI